MKLHPFFVIMIYVACGVSALCFLFWLVSSGRGFFSLLFQILFFPFTLLKKFQQWRLKRRQEVCRKLCAEYFFVIGNHPQTIRYFEEMIQGGIRPKQLKKILEANLIHYKTLNLEQQLQNLDATYRNQANLSEFLKEREELLAQTRIHLEQLRNKEQLLGKIYDKLNQKYQRELPLPQETTDE